jgi:hypothetical protein
VAALHQAPSRFLTLMQEISASHALPDPASPIVIIHWSFLLLYRNIMICCWPSNLLSSTPKDNRRRGSTYETGSGMAVNTSCLRSSEPVTLETTATVGLPTQHRTSAPSSIHFDDSRYYVLLIASRIKAKTTLYRIQQDAAIPMLPCCLFSIFHHFGFMAS